MKKFLAVIAAAVLLLSGCKADNKPLLKTGILRVAVTNELDNSEEIAKTIADSMGVPCELIKTDRDAAPKMLADGIADIAIGCFSERENPNLTYRLTLPIAENRIYFVCGKELYFSDTSQLEGRVIGADADLPQTVRSSLLSIAMDKKFICDNAITAAEMLKSGNIEAYVCFEDEAIALISENKELRCCTPADIEPERYCVLLHGEKTELFGAVNGAIGEAIILQND